MAEAPAPERIAIVLHSGSYDRVSYAMSLATVALAMGSEVHILLTYGGLKRFTRGHLEDLGDETPGELRRRLGLALGSGGIVTLEQAVVDAKRLGLKLYACANAMATLDLTRDELVDAVDESIGLVRFVKIARTATINWYI